MIEISVPGYRCLSLHHLVMDYNGTLAMDGVLLQGVGSRLENLAAQLQLHVVTADTFGQARLNLTGLPCTVEILPAESQDQAKLAYVERIGAEGVVAIGNGRNDHLMVAAAALGIAILGPEGAAWQTASAAQVVTSDILSALDLLSHPKRLVATLRT
jgi:soluble P-type ATPase